MVRIFDMADGGQNRVVSGEVASWQPMMNDRTRPELALQLASAVPARPAAEKPLWMPPICLPC